MTDTDTKTLTRILSFVVFLVSAKIMFAYPISPITLRTLIERSQYIVIATIDNPEKGEKYFDPKINDTLTYFTFGGDGLADLHITEVLKGKPGSDHIRVTYEAGMVCPAPPYYPDKRTVIAFLMKEDTATTYYTYGLSYGSKVMQNDMETDLYRKKIKEYIAILKRTHGSRRHKAMIEWLVTCAEHPYTRWEGAYELSRSRYFMAYYDRSKDKKLYKKLNTKQINRLDSVFFASDTLGYNELCLVDIIPQKHYTQLKTHLLNNLRFVDYYLKQDIMKQILIVFPDDELKKLCEQLSDILYDKEKESERKMLVEKFIMLAENKG